MLYSTVFHLVLYLPATYTECVSKFILLRIELMDLHLVTNLEYSIEAMRASDNSLKQKQQSINEC